MRMDSHMGPLRGSIGHVVALSFAVAMVLGGGWASSAAGASEEQASRGPKDARQSCSSSSDESPAHHGEDRPARGRSLGHRQRAAATVRPAASSGRGSRDGCPEGEPSRPGSGAEGDADDDQVDASRSDPSQADAPANEHQRPAAGTMGSSGAGDERSTNSSGVRYDGRRGDAPARPNAAPGNASSNNTKAGGAGEADGVPSSSGTDDAATTGSGEADGTGSPAIGSEGRNGGSSGGSSVGGGSNRRRSSGGGGASSGGHGGGRGGGHGNAPRGGAGGAGGGTSGPAGVSSGDPDTPAGFRIAPVGPPKGRRALDPGTGVPGIRWASFRTPGVALAASPAIPTLAAGAPSAARAAPTATGTATVHTTAGVPAGPLARTGEETSASVFLATMLILVGAVLRRSGHHVSLRDSRVAAETPS